MVSVCCENRRTANLLEARGELDLLDFEETKIEAFIHDIHLSVHQLSRKKLLPCLVCDPVV